MFNKRIETDDYVIPPAASDITNRTPQASHRSVSERTEDSREKTVRGIRNDFQLPPLPPSSALVTSQSASRKPLPPKATTTPTMPSPTNKPIAGIETIQPPSTTTAALPLKTTEDQHSKAKSKPSTSGSSKKKVTSTPSTKTPIQKSTKKKESDSLRVRSTQRTNSDAASLHTGISLADTTSIQPTTTTCIDWDNAKVATTTLNLSSNKAPKLFSVEIRWLLLFWGVILCGYDVSMVLSAILGLVLQNAGPYLRKLYHFMFFLTLPSGPTLIYLMISGKVSILWWKTHLSCQIFRIVMNIYLVFDYIFIWNYEYEYYKIGTVSTTDPNHNPKLIDQYFNVSISILGIITVLTIILYGFAVYFYYYEKEALKKKQEKWRRRINEVFENQGIEPDIATTISEDILSGKKCEIVMARE